MTRPPVSEQPAGDFGRASAVPTSPLPDVQASAEDTVIRFIFEWRGNLEPLWYDEHWHKEMLAEGITDEKALKLMLKSAWEEDWSSVVEEMIPSAQAFVDSVTWVRAVTVSFAPSPDARHGDVGTELRSPQEGVS